MFFLLCIGVLFHGVVGRIALVMAIAAASGGLTSTIISGLVQVCEYRVLLIENVYPCTCKCTVIGSLYMH